MSEHVEEKKKMKQLKKMTFLFKPLVRRMVAIVSNQLTQDLVCVCVCL